MREIQRSWIIWGRRFAREVEGLLLVASDLTYDELFSSLRRIRGNYLSELKMDSTASLEIRRRISEHELEFALERSRPLAVCRRKFKQCALLKFTDPSREAHFRLLYAESMAKRRHRRASFLMVRATITLLNLNREGKKLNREQDKAYRKWAARIMRDLEGA